MNYIIAYCNLLCYKLSIIYKNNI